MSIEHEPAERFSGIQLVTSNTTIDIGEDEEGFSTFSTTSILLRDIGPVSIRGFRNKKFINDQKHGFRLAEEGNMIGFTMMTADILHVSEGLYLLALELHTPKLTTPLSCTMTNSISNLDMVYVAPFIKDSIYPNNNLFASQWSIQPMVWRSPSGLYASANKDFLSNLRFNFTINTPK